MIYYIFFCKLTQYIYTRRDKSRLYRINIQMKRYLIQLSYKGTEFHGWQLQNNAITIQGEIERVISMILRTEIRIVGAGRTDTAVHAKFYIAHFDVEKEILDKPKLVSRLNKILHKDISIQKIEKVSEKFHSRFDAKSRTYEYHIHLYKNPFLNDLSSFLYYLPDVQKMNEACNILFDYEDFTSFAKLNSGAKTNLCKIYFAEWKQKDNQLIFTIKANRFLRNMVRAIVGTLLEVGRNKINLDDFRQIIETKNRSSAGQSVSACGLFLTDIEY